MNGSDQMGREARDTQDRIVMTAGLFLPGGLFLAVIGFQIIVWLRTGEWPGWTLADGLIFIGVSIDTLAIDFNWKGIGAIYYWILNLNLIIATFVAGCSWSLAVFGAYDGN